MKYNYHTHTFRCHHADGKDEDYVKQAIEHGFESIGFSDHCPYVFPQGYVSTIRMLPEEAPEYVQSIRELAAKYAGQIEIKVGFEMEWYPDLIPVQSVFLKTLDLDYLILAQHFTENEYERVSVYAGSKTRSNKILDKYIEQLIAGAESGLFSYVCHPDLINFAGSDKVYKNKMRAMLQRLKELDLPVELNLLGYCGGRQYPSKRFFELVKEVGNDVVIGIDAHTPDFYDKDYYLNEMVREFSDDCGIVPLEEVKLIKPKF